MPHWLIYTKCADCVEASCLQCRSKERSLNLHVVEQDAMPDNALNGPCASPEEILQRMGQHFYFDESGMMQFKIE